MLHVQVISITGTYESYVQKNIVVNR